MQVQLKVNGKAVSLDVAPNTLLVQALRGNLQLTGTHVGCDTAQCGACTVVMNGRSVKSCTILAGQAEGDPKEAAAQWAARLEAEYDMARLRSLIDNHGRQPG